MRGNTFLSGRSRGYRLVLHIMTQIALFIMFQVRDETNLASSSMAETGDPNDLLGVIVSYSVRVKIALSGMGGDLEVDIPFKLVHPRPGTLY